MNHHLVTREPEVYKDTIATVDNAGKRVWLYPKKPNGRFYDYRKWVSYGLLLVLFGLPFIEWNKKPFVLLNVLEGKFILFGYYFAPHDFHLFVVAMLIGMVFIALFTVVFGRIFCGWVCPQTIFMEMVFRRIEYWIEGDSNAQKRLDKAKWNSSKWIKKVSKHLIFLIISFLIAHTFLSYIIGLDSVIELTQSSLVENWRGFLSMILFTLIFYGVFARMREQVCTTICPYGRLQGVLLDADSLTVAYDFIRGEPRGKMVKPRKGKKSNCTTGCSTCTSGGNTCPTDVLNTAFGKIEEKLLGDCIDCKLCVQVCPTGIDIRNGTQLECVNCTACMDACDEVMLKIGRPTELIRIDSYNGITSGKRKIWNNRAIAYSIILVLLLATESFLFISRSSVEVLFLRTPGMMYQELDGGLISNLYNYQLINKTDAEYVVTFKSESVEGIQFETIGGVASTIANEVSEGAVFIKIPKTNLSKRSTELHIEIWADDQIIDETTTSFLGPLK